MQKSKRSKKSSRKEEKRSKEHMSAPVRLSEFLAADSDSDDDGAAPRSAISGKKVTAASLLASRRPSGVTG